MSEKLDLNRMLNEISEQTEGKSAKSRPLTQEEIKRMIAEKAKKKAGSDEGAKS